MLVSDVMSTPALTVPVDAPVALAVAMLDQHSVTMLPVLDSHHRLAGVLSEYDVLRDVLSVDQRLHLIPAADDDVAGGLPHTGPGVVEELMTRQPIAVHSHTDLSVAVDLMTTTAVKSLPVIDDERRVIGVVSRRDIVRALARADIDIEREIDDLLRRIGADWLVDVTGGVVTITGPERPNERALAAAAAHGVVGVRTVTINP
jgi:CBS-domain-containing membrane protein